MPLEVLGLKHPYNCELLEYTFGAMCFYWLNFVQEPSSVQNTLSFDRKEEL